jgi:hypothetical protein
LNPGGIRRHEEIAARGELQQIAIAGAGEPEPDLFVILLFAVSLDGPLVKLAGIAGRRVSRWKEFKPALRAEGRRRGEFGQRGVAG